MDSNTLGQQRNELARQRLQSFRGSAVIPFRNLSLGDEHRNKTNISRLTKIFELEGCANLDPENRIAAVIPSDVLNEVLQKQNISNSSLMDPGQFPCLDLGDKTIDIIYGRHRLIAGFEFGLHKWLVDLYLDTLSHDSRIGLKEGFPNSLEYTDGEIYRNIRLNQLQNNKLQEQKWWSRLRSDGRRTNFRRLQKHKDFLRGFDLLLPFVGFWRPLRSSHIERMLAFRYPQMIYQYVWSIHVRWSAVFSSDNQYLLDADSIGLLEGLCPHISLKDREHILELINSKTVFPMVLCERETLAQCLVDFPGRLISIHTLVQDTLFMNGPVKGLHQICDIETKGDFLTTMRRSWTSFGDQTIEIQISEHQSVKREKSRTPVEVSILQLWLFALRHFVDNIPKPDRTDKRSFSVWTKALNLWNLSKLAKSAGFQSSKITELANQKRKFIKEIPRDLFHTLYDDQTEKMRGTKLPEDFVPQVLEYYLKKRAPRDTEAQSASFTTDDPSQNAERRYNTPSSDQYSTLRRHLFLWSIFKEDVSLKDYPTPLGVTRDILICFFGDIQKLVDDLPDTSRQQNVETSLVNIDGHDTECISPTRQDSADIQADALEQVNKSPDNQQIAGDVSMLDPDPGNISQAHILEHPESGAPASEKHLIPLAVGFEEKKAETILKDWFESENTQLVVFFLLESREYYKFLKEDVNVIRSEIRFLSQEHRFLSIHEDYGLQSPDFDKTLDEALRQQLILVERKDKAGNPNIPEDTMSVDQLREYMKVWDVKSGKRKAGDDHKKPNKRVLL
ncbi:hypothetical protein N7468_000744 [Penicillium chermesinum]|uniref:Uncharacterized protein n=1 Tax=Penicillium chermesinum TaxID=63820 RepID=A0A9W9PMK4_9EURO|nr:uncharacterized protein N7468_000744 [Penicillium chermesinum]KAJ5249293.1 hypothetical protein N7468_000744 [Penicillium chermesinum]